MRVDVCPGMRARSSEESVQGVSEHLCSSPDKIGPLLAPPAAAARTPQLPATHGAGSAATVGRLLPPVAMETRDPGAGCLQQCLIDPALCVHVCVKDGERPGGMPASTQCPAEHDSSCLAAWKGVFP